MRLRLTPAARLIAYIILTVIISTAQIAKIGGPSWDLGFSAVRLPDNSYVILGYTWSFGQGNYDMYFVRLDATGNIIWTRTVGGVESDYGYRLIYTHDGYLVAVGHTWSYGQDPLSWADMYIVKLDTQGNIIWTRVIGGQGNHEYGADLVELSDGSIVALGRTGTFGQGGYDLYVVKFTSSGNLVWTRTIGGSADEYPGGITVSSDGNLIIAGSTRSFGAGNYDCYIVKLDTAGNLIWTRTLGETSADYCRDVVATNDGGCIAVGDGRTTLTSSSDIRIFRLDANGNLVWDLIVGGSGWEYGFSVTKTLDGNFAVAGSTTSFGASGEDMYLIKVDKSGNLLWGKVISRPDRERANYVTSKPDGGFVLIGFLNQNLGGGVQEYAILMVKTDANGNLPSSSCATILTGGNTGSGVLTGSGGAVSSGGSVTSGGNAGSGGNVNICGPFPLQLLRLKAYPANNGILLQWQLEAGPTPIKWIIKRKELSHPYWQPLTTIYSSNTHYKWIDTTAQPLKYYQYQVTVILQDGTQISSNTVTASIHTDKQNNTVIPVLVTVDQTYIKVPLNNPKTGLRTFKLINASGKELQEFTTLITPQTSSITIHTGNLPPGMYFLWMK